MSTQCPACGGDGVIDVETSGWSAGDGSGGVTDDGSRYRIAWRAWPKLKKALFRVTTDDRVAVLQHVREIQIQQRGESYCEVLEDVSLDEIPDKFLEEMRRDGFEPANGVKSRA